MKNKIKEKVKAFYKEEMLNFNKVREQKLNSFIRKMHIDNLCREKQIIKLHAELQTLMEEHDDSERKEFLLFSDSKQQLFTLFFNHLMINRTNEIKHIKESILLKEKIEILKTLLSIKENHLSPVTYQQYLNQSHSKDFNQLETNTSLEDYYKIKKTHSKRIHKAIQFELRHMKSSFLQQGESLTNNTIRKEIENVDHPERLIALRNSRVPNDLSPYTITPRTDETLQTPLKEADRIIYRYKNSLTPKISNPQIFNLSLQKYIVWLHQLLQVNTIPKNTLNIYNYSKIFNTIYKEAGKVAREEISQTKLSKSPEQIEIIKDTLSHLDNLVNRLEIPVFTQPDKNKQQIQAEFYNHLIFNHCNNATISKLFLTVKISILVDYYTKQLNKLNKRFNIPYNFPSYAQIIDLIPCMLPNSETYNQILITLNIKTSQLQHNCKPVYFIEEEIKSQLISIFNSAATHLDEIYSCLDYNTSAKHALVQKHKLELLELSNERNNLPSCPQISILKRMFQSELDYSLNALKLENTDLEHLLYPPEKPKFSFGYKYQDSSTLYNAIKAINLNIELLMPGNTCKQFSDLLTAKKVKPGKEKIFIKCPNKVFRFIIMELKPHFENLTNKSIEKSKSFYSHNGTLFTAKNIGNAKLTDIPQKIVIKQIIKEIATKKPLPKHKGKGRANKPISEYNDCR